MTPEQFRNWRENLGWSRREAAEALGLSQGSVELYELGKRKDDGRSVAIPKNVELACAALMLGIQGWPEPKRSLTSRHLPKFGLNSTTYDDVRVGHDTFGVPRLFFRRDGDPLVGIDLTALSQLKQMMLADGDESSELQVAAYIAEAQALDRPIYVDPAASAVLDHGAHTERYLTLQEAKFAFDNLPPERREVATISTQGKTYRAPEIARFHAGPNA